MSSEAPRIMPAHTRNEAPAFNAIDVNTCYWSKELPDLGLVMDMKLPFRVYVMACEPRSWGGPKTVYVGIANRSQIARRIQTDVGQGPSAPHFCQTYAPQYILGVFPAASRAVEAFAFYALAANRSERSLSCGALGGWTQTSTDLSKLSKLNLERERRMVAARCLKCGSEEQGHNTKNCQAEASALVTCAFCNVQNRISDRGVVLGAVRPRDPMAAEVRDVRPRTSEPTVHARPPQVIQPSPATVSVPVTPLARAPPSAREFLQVRICGVGYTTLAWYLGKTNPTPREVNLALEHGTSHAALISDGQASTLVAAGFAKLGPRLPADLFPAGNGSLPAHPVSTLAKTVKSGIHVKIRAAPARLTGSRNVLFRTADLKNVK